MFAEVMKASELRIGNWVCDIYEEEEFQLDIVDMCDMDINGDLYRTDPIPLTEEWLLKFGFKKRDVLSSVLYDMKNPRFSVYLNPPIDKSNKWNILGIEKNINIKHVHQLQNLYFAITGAELTIKEQ
jgi:hypothetical protein